MTRYLIIGLFALGLCGCASTQLPPLDDAYYWEKNQPAQSSQNTQSTQIIQNTPNTPNTPNTQTTPAGPAIDYLNVQDTTVTIRIKK